MKQIGRLKRRSANLLIAVPAAKVAKNPFQPVPFCDVINPIGSVIACGKYVVRAFGGGEAKGSHS
jgi:hypothetical protein